MSETTEDFSELAIPEEPGVYWCWRHRKVKTRLRCGRCEKPICPQCTVMGPTGSRCRECASNRSQHIYQVSPLQYVMTFAVALVLGLFCGWLLQGLRFFALFLAPVAGTIVGKAITGITRGKRGTPLATLASVGTVLGTLIPFWMLWGDVIIAANRPGAEAAVLALAPAMLLQLLILVVFLLFVIPAIWYWIK